MGALRFFSSGSNIASPDGTIPSGQWVYVAFTLDNGTGFLYLNGNQSSTDSLTLVNTSAGDTLLIGERVSGAVTRPFAGAIDEVRIWNIARTQAEIMANMNSEFCSPPSSFSCLL